MQHEVQISGSQSFEYLVIILFLSKTHQLFRLFGLRRKTVELYLYKSLPLRQRYTARLVGTLG